MESWQYKAAKDRDLTHRDRLRSVRREHGLIGAATCTFRWGLVRSALRFLHRLRVEGRENIPVRPPFILIGNHASHLDALVMTSLLPAAINPHVFPIAAGDTFFCYKTTALLSGLFLNVLPMARDGSGGGSLMALRDRLLEGECGFLLFPEGTRTRSGEMGRFKAGVGMLVAGTSVPVVPYYLSGTFEAWPPSQRLPRPYPVTVRIGMSMNFSGFENHRLGWRAIADELETAVTMLAEPSES